jgi:aminopeptidase YwaD
MSMDRYTDYMYSLIKKVIDEIGPRPSCSEEEKRLGRLLVEEWQPFCDKVEAETFTCSPTAFLGFIRFSVLLYFAAVVLYWFYPLASFILVAIGSSMVFFEFLRYREFIDFLFPSRQGENIMGTIGPRGEATRRVIVSAHMDSAYEFNFIYYLRKATILVIDLGMAGIAIALFGSLAKTIAYYYGFADATAFAVVGYIMIAFTPIVGLFLFFHTYKPVPGAMDDMAGIAVVAGLGKYLKEAQSRGEWSPEKTEVVLLATSSEEAGLRGAKRYASKHVQEMKTTPTYGLFLDNIYDEKQLTVVNKEICTRATHDPDLIEMAQDAAANHKWPIAVRSIPIEGGGTDAAAFSVKGIPSVCLLCQDISQAVPNYHTRNDTYEHIRPESLSVSLQLVLDMLKQIDKK